MLGVREVLRGELTARGYEVASDTVASRGELYVIGENDLAAALFEFKANPREAIDTMYQGSWGHDMPPRFAVMHADATYDPEFELLEQMHVIPLLYTVTDGVPVFCNLEALDQHLPT